MGRPKKVVEEDKEVIENSIEVKAVVVEAPKKVERVYITAKFKAIDEEGNRMILPFDSEGSSIEDALTNMEFPKGINALVNVTLTRGDKTMTKAFAPHKARQTLEYKDVQTFKDAFRGF